MYNNQTYMVLVSVELVIVPVIVLEVSAFL